MAIHTSHVVEARMILPAFQPALPASGTRLGCLDWILGREAGSLQHCRGSQVGHAEAVANQVTRFYGMSRNEVERLPRQTTADFGAIRTNLHVHSHHCTNAREGEHVQLLPPLWAAAGEDACRILGMR